MSVALEFRLHILWTEFFPDQAWPGDPAAALEYIAAEVRMLRETDVRPTAEIQMAHDILVQLMLDQPVFDIVAPGKDQQQVFRSNCDALCWALHHDHNQTFENNFAAAMERLNEIGMGVLRFNEMQNRQDER